MVMDVLADEVSILVVASYHCIMSILVLSICIEPSLWESHITISERFRARSVRKLYNYSRVLLWIMSPLAGCDRTGTTLYVARGGVWCSFIPCWVWRQWTCICIAFALFEVYFYWGFMLAWSRHEEYYFYLYEEYCFIHLWISFIYCISCPLLVYGNFIG
jgi:hypothetical protein